MTLEHQFNELNEQKTNLDAHFAMITREMDALMRMKSDMTIVKEDMRNEWKQDFLVKRQEIDHLKEELDRERQEVDRLKNNMDKEKVDIEMMKSDLQNQSDELDQIKKDVLEEKKHFEAMNVDLMNKSERFDSLFEEVNRDKEMIKDQIFQVEKEKKDLEKVKDDMSTKQIEQEMKDNVMKRQITDLQNSKALIQVERAELEKLKNDVIQKKADNEIFTESITQEKEHLKQMKTDVDQQTIILEMDLSELKTKEDAMLITLNTIENQRIKFKERSEKTNEEIKRKMDSIGHKNDDVQRLKMALEHQFSELNEHKKNLDAHLAMITKQMDDLVRMKSDMTIVKQDMRNEWKQDLLVKRQEIDQVIEELVREREEFDRVKNQMDKEKVDIEMMKADLEKQSDELDQIKKDVQEEKENLVAMKVDLMNKSEKCDSLFEVVNRDNEMIKDQMAQVEKEKKALEKVKDYISTKQTEQEMKDSDIKTQITDLQNSKALIQVERAELEKLKKDVEKKADDEIFTESITQEKEHLKLMKTDVDQQKIILEKDLSELKTKENAMLITLNTIENQRTKLKELSEKNNEEIKRKMDIIGHKNDDVLRLKMTLEHQFNELNEQKTNLDAHLAIITREMDALMRMKSDMTIVKDDMRNEWKQDLLVERQELDWVKEELGREREEFNRLKNKMDKDKVYMMKADIQTQSDELQSSNALVQVERAELEKLRNNAMQKKADNEIFMETITQEKEHIKQMKIDVDQQKINVEKDLSELKIKQDGVMIALNVIATQRTKLKELNTNTNEVIKRKMYTIGHKNDYIQRLSTTFEHQFNELNEQKKNLGAHIDLITREMDALIRMKSDMTALKEDMRKEWKQELLVEIKALDQLKEELGREMAEDGLKKNKMNIEIFDLRVDIQKQSDELDKIKKDVLEEKERLEIIKVDLKNKSEKSDSLFEDREEMIKDQMSQLEKEKKNVEKVRNDISLKQTEQDITDADIKRQMQVLQNSNVLMQAERAELDKIKNDVMQKKAENEILMESLTQEKDHLKQMWIDLAQQKKELENNLSALKMRVADTPKQSDEFDQVKKVVKDDKERQEIMKADSQKQLDVDCVLEEIHREKELIKDQMAQVVKEKDELETMKNAISLKQTEQQMKDDDIKRQIQHLQNSLKVLSAEREELELLKTDMKRRENEVMRKEKDMNNYQYNENKTRIALTHLISETATQTDEMEIEPMEQFVVEDLEPDRRRKETDRQYEVFVKPMMSQKNIDSSMQENVCQVIDSTEHMAVGTHQHREDIQRSMDHLRFQKKELEIVLAEKCQAKNVIADLKEEEQSIKGNIDNMNIIFDHICRKLQLHKDDIEAKTEEISVKSKDLDMSQLKADIAHEKQIIENNKDMIAKEKENLDQIKLQIMKKRQELDTLHTLQRDEKELEQTRAHVQRTEEKNEKQRAELKNEKQELELLNAQQGRKVIEDGTREQAKDQKIQREDNKLKTQMETLGIEQVDVQPQLGDFDYPIIEKKKDKDSVSVEDMALQIHLEAHAEHFMKMASGLEVQIKVKKQETDEMTFTMADVKHNINQIRCEMERKQQQIDNIRNQIARDMARLKKTKSDIERGKYEVERAEPGTEDSERSANETTDKVKDEVGMHVDMQNQRQLEEIHYHKEEVEQDKKKIKLTVDINTQLKEMQNQSEEIELENVKIQTEKTNAEQIQTDLQTQSENIACFMEKGKVDDMAIQHLNETIECLLKYIQKKAGDLELWKVKNKELEVSLMDIDRHNVEMRKQQQELRDRINEVQRAKKDLEKIKADLQTQPGDIVQFLQETKERKGQTTKEKLEQKDPTKLSEMWRPVELEVDEIDKQRQAEEEADLTTQYTKSVDPEYFETPVQTEDLSKADYLREIWKETELKRREITKMRHKGYEMRASLENRLKSVHKFLQRVRIQRKKDPSEELEATLEQGKLTLQHKLERDLCILHDKCQELESLKDQMLKETDSQEKESTLKTVDKAIQTFLVDISTENSMLQVMGEQDETTPTKTLGLTQKKTWTHTKGENVQEETVMSVQEDMSAQEASSGLLGLLRHYCFNCCCRCCDCCRQETD